MMVLMMLMMALMMTLMINANDVDDNVDDVDDNNEGHGGDDVDDIYIMIYCLCVCLSRKIITSHFQAERQRREVSCLLGLAGCRPALAL